MRENVKLDRIMEGVREGGRLKIAGTTHFLNNLTFKCVSPFKITIRHNLGYKIDRLKLLYDTGLESSLEFIHFYSVLSLE